MAKVVFRYLLVGSLAFPLAAWAQVPAQMSYEGRLLSASGAPVQGTKQFHFVLWPAAEGGTAPLWSDTYSVAVTDGLYSVQLGGDADVDGGTSPLPLSIFDGSTLYLEIAVNGETLSPRQPVTSVAYAMKAGTATNATNVSGGSVDATWVSVNSTPVIDNTGHLTGAAAADFLKTAATNAPIVGNGTASSPIGISQCTATSDGYLSAADWNAFNNKVASADSRLADARNPLPGSGDYIQNILGSSTPQSASFNIVGSGYIGGSVGIGTTNNVDGNALIIGDATASSNATSSAFISIHQHGLKSDRRTGLNLHTFDNDVEAGSPNHMWVLEASNQYSASLGKGLYIDEYNDPNGSGSCGNNSTGALCDVRRFYIQDGTGNIGIGTTSPAYKLDVQTTQNGGVRFKTPSAGTQHFVMDTDGTTNQQISLFRQSGGATDYLNIGKFFNGAYFDTDGSYSFNISGVQKMVLTTSGNLGIEATPTFPLTVGGTTRLGGGGAPALLMQSNSQAYPATDDGTDATAAFAVSGNFSGGSAEMDIWNNVVSGGPRGFRFLQKTGTSAATDLMYIQGTGNVGIGTTSPTAKLQVAGGDVAISTQGSGVIMKATDGPNCFRLTVNNSGVLSTTNVPCP